MTNTPMDKSEENRKASEDAMRLAQEQQQRDILAGVPTNPAQLQSKIAESVKKKLENDEYAVFVDENGNPVPPAAGTE